MRVKTIIICVFAIAIYFESSAQKIIVDTTSANKYIIKQPRPKSVSPDTIAKENLTFGDRAVSIGKGILNRLKARLNLEEASESLKAKKEKLLGKKEEEPAPQPDQSNEN